MKLSLISENSNILTLYKGVSEYSGLKNWPTHKVDSKGKHIPGFLSNWDIGRVYSEPTLTGPPNSAGMIAEFTIDPHTVENRTEEFLKWCDENDNSDYDISISFPDQWRNDGSIWTVCDSGSAHGDAIMTCFSDASFVYCGIPLPYTVVAFYNNQDEWQNG